MIGVDPLRCEVVHTMCDSSTSILLGLRVEAIEQSESSAYFLRFADGFWLRIDSLWRLLVSGKLVVTSLDDGQFFGRTEPVLSRSELSDMVLGRSVTSLHVGMGTADLALGFGEVTLQIISDSAGYEAWEFAGPAGTIAVGQGGGNVAELPAISVQPAMRAGSSVETVSGEGQ